jgi:hypothetical protein
MRSHQTIRKTAQAVVAKIKIKYCHLFAQIPNCRFLEHHQAGGTLRQTNPILLV